MTRTISFEDGLLFAVYDARRNSTCVLRLLCNTRDIGHSHVLVNRTEVFFFASRKLYAYGQFLVFTLNKDIIFLLLDMY